MGLIKENKKEIKINAEIKTSKEPLMKFILHPFQNFYSFFNWRMS